MRELSIALLLLSGILKAQLQILAPWVPDITVLALILVFSSFIFFKADSPPTFLRAELVGISAFFLFVLCVFLSTLYSPSVLVLQKLTKFTLPIFAFMVALTTTNINWKGLAYYYIAFTLIAAAMFVYIFPRFRLGLLGDEASFYSGTYLGFADACAVSLVLLQLIRQSHSAIAYFSLVIFFLFCMVLSGARGPLIFFLLLASLWSAHRSIRWLMRYRSLNKYSVIWAILGVPLVITALAFSVDLQKIIGADIFKTMGYSIDRLFLLIGEDKGGSVNVRVDHLVQSIYAIDRHVWSGVGFAAYGASVLGNDTWDYPHNMLLEVWVESGLVALIFLLAFISVVYYRLASIPNRSFMVFIISYCLMNAMKSSSFADNRVLFFWLGAALVYSGLQRFHLEPVCPSAQRRID